jgi:UPF0755 protein
MSFIKNLLTSIIILIVLAAAGLTFWARQPITTNSQSIEFTVKPGSTLRSSAQQIADAGIPLNPILFEMLVRATNKSAKLKAGNYELKPSATPLMLIEQLARGEFAQESLAIIEGWTFRQMRQAIASHPALKHDTVDLSDQQILEKIAADFHKAEGLFFPDTYLFAKGASDLQIYKQAHEHMMKRLHEAWEKREASLPYKTPYEGLIMASIVEKETGQTADRNMIAAVFINRLKLGMMLQTDPTVIYGMGDQYNGNIRKGDLKKDTPYNTYTRTGLPPTPIALPGAESLLASFKPAKSDALYFVSRGDGSSQFSSNLNDHNRAVNQYQRKE